MKRITLVLTMVLLVSASLAGCGVPSIQTQFTASPTDGEGITLVQFSDQSTGEITSWAWDLDGDGIIDSTKQNPTYTYDRDGLFSVTLTVTGPDGKDTLTKRGYIHITGCST